MKKFIVVKRNGNKVTILAVDLDDAEEKANQRIKTWESIYRTDIKRMAQ